MEKLNRLKKQYESLKKKYKLPEFSKLNEDFEIEKLQEHETDFLLREIRRTMVEKISVVLKFLEIMINPNEASPPFVFAMIKEMKPEMKKSVENMYKELSLVEISSITLDLDYGEKSEAKFIKEHTKKWEVTKKDLRSLIKSMDTIWKLESNKKSYVG
ncbi:MAG: hypothetical protein KKE23_01955 [Nanoarchaeota archaeon]|nr:hypothetical protein [Nanoarchaeota archaeon]